MADELCKICAIHVSKYVCPRCNLLYCSVQCYQSRLHTRCSEEFYKESVLEQMSLDERDPEDVNKMKEILSRTHNDNSENSDDDYDDSLDSDDELDIAERLNSVSLDDADAVWEKLSVSEKQAFVEFLKSESPENLVPLWEPWWTFRKVKPKIELIGDSSNLDSSVYSNKCPIIKSVPPLPEITKVSPSPCVKWNIINIIGSYAYIMRYFNGEPKDFCLEAINLLLSISGNLGKNYNYESYDSAVEDISQKVLQKSSLDGSDCAHLNMYKDDVQRILHGPEESNASFYLLAALSDIINLFEQTKCAPKSKDYYDNYACTKEDSSFSKQFKNSTVDQVSKTKVKLSIKKVEYYLAWVKACPSS